MRRGLRDLTGGSGTSALSLTVPNHHCNYAVPAWGFGAHRGHERTLEITTASYIDLELGRYMGQGIKSPTPRANTKAGGPVTPWTGHITSDL